MKSISLLLLALPVLAQQPGTEAHLRTLLQTKTGTVTLPSGTIEITREIALPPDAHDLEIKGSNTVLKASSAFRGRSLLSLAAGRNIKIHDVMLDGNRAAFSQPVPAPQPAAMLARVVPNNGIVAENVTGLEIFRLDAKEFAGFPILITGGSHARIHDVRLTDSGSLDIAGHNNGTGGLALEEGASDFEVSNAVFGKVRGNGIWIRSTGPTASKGRITANEFEVLARSAIEMNHASDITISGNTGHMIGFPGEEVLIAGTVLPAAIVTSGSVDRATIQGNTFDEIAGRCMSLDGISNSEIATNVCGDGLFNALLVRGTANRVTGNRFTGMNTARRDQPESLRDGIYLAGGASGNTVTGNEIGGYGMAKFCVGGPQGVVEANTVKNNACVDASSVAGIFVGPGFGWFARSGLLPAAYYPRNRVY
ncbi:MAG TPA: right-handed parallel beta-helix repeat-containing protein [Bryobacteraceae bacterium]|nr:right-handed parallel beta-helix repeat-containing protein [Bryobacteraceae bacterium]